MEEHKSNGNGYGVYDGPGIIQHLMAGGQMLPAQLPGAYSWSPEKRLAAAVLSAALLEIRDYGGDPTRRKRLAEDLQWIASDDTDWPFSFVRLCQLFGLQPSWVREVVQRWQTARFGKSRRSSSLSREAA